jgi:diguanylate cyclase (GGDEF)-like protein/PAS domain S-box-containing protein
MRTRLWLVCMATALSGLLAIGIGSRATHDEAARAAVMARIAMATAPRVGDRTGADPEVLAAWRTQRAELQSALRQHPLTDGEPRLAEALMQWESAGDTLEREWDAWVHGSRPAPHANRAGVSRTPDVSLPALALASAGARAEQARARLVAAWSEAAGEARQAQNRMLTLAAMLFGVLVLGASLAIEPTVRALQRQRRQLQDQAGDLERLAVVARLTSNAVMITDEHGRISWVNDGFTRMLGYTLAEAVGLEPTQLLAGERSDASTLGAMRDARQQGLAFTGELLCCGKDGVNRWIDIDLQPLRSSQGSPRGSITVGTDITALVRERQHHAAILASVPTGVLVFDRHGSVIDCNASAGAILMRPRSELLSSGLSDLPWSALREDRAPFRHVDMPSYRALHEGQPQRDVSLGIVTPAGEVRWLLVNAEPLFDAAGSVERVITSFVDVSALRSQEQVLAATVDGAGLGLWEWDLRSDSTSITQRLGRMLGYPAGELDGARHALLDLVHPEDRDRFVDVVRQHLRDPRLPCRQELRLRRPDGDWSWGTASGAIVERSVHGVPLRMAGVIVDMTEHMQMQAMLMHTAHTDSLTQLPNRSQLMERLNTAVGRWQSDPTRHFALLYMDFDRFKLVNDTHGHEMGDALLRQIAERLLGALRRSETSGSRGTTTALAARIGGDEFVVLLEGIDGLHTARAIGERLLTALAEPYALGRSLRVHSSASIGIVSSEQCSPEADAHSVLRDADTAMYEAKRAGRGRAVVFDPSMHQALARRSELEAELRQALSAGDIVPAYQPIIDLASGRATGVEALARWQHPQRGAVSPMEFIPVAEEAGLISALGHAMLAAACRDFVRWRRELGDSAPTSLAVNLSRAQLMADGLVEDVAQVIAASGIDSRCLQLEVTESLAGEEASVQSALRRLKELGLTLALDDFGTGYSSLACLHLLPVDSVKLDRSFVRDAQANEVHRVLIQATVQVARALGMSTVAEGVETDGQAALVHSLGCNRAQGYLFSKPLFSTDLERWLVQWPLRQAA